MYVTTVPENGTVVGVQLPVDTACGITASIAKENIFDVARTNNIGTVCKTCVHA